MLPLLFALTALGITGCANQTKTKMIGSVFNQRKKKRWMSMDIKYNSDSDLKKLLKLIKNHNKELYQKYDIKFEKWNFFYHSKKNKRLRIIREEGWWRTRKDLLERYWFIKKKMDNNFEEYKNLREEVQKAGYSVLDKVYWTNQAKQYRTFELHKDNFDISLSYLFTCQIDIFWKNNFDFDVEMLSLSEFLGRRLSSTGIKYRIFKVYINKGNQVEVHPAIRLVIGTEEKFETQKSFNTWVKELEEDLKKRNISRKDQGKIECTGFQFIPYHTTRNN